MQKKPRSRNRSVAIQSTDLHESDTEAAIQTGKLVKKLGFRNLLQQTVTIVPLENGDRQDYEPMSGGKRSRSVQADLDTGSMFKHPKIRDKNNSLEFTRSRKFSFGREEDFKKSTTELVKMNDKGISTAKPGTSKLISAAVSTYSVYSQIKGPQNEESLALVYNSGDKADISCKSSNIAHLFGSQQSRRFSDETVLLIEDYQSYDYRNTTRHREMRLFGRRRSFLLCCPKLKDMSKDVLARPIPLVIEETAEVSVCRICHDGEDSEPLIQPCLCKGSVGNVHASCLKIWLEQSSMSRCELCNYPYAIRQTKKYAKCYSIRVFCKTILNKRALVYDIASFVIISPLTVVGVSMCIQASVFSQADIELADADKQMENITKAGMILLSVTIIVAYVIWLYTLLSFHYKTWKRWYENAFDIEVLPVRMTSEDRMEAIQTFSKEISRRDMQRTQGPPLVSVLQSPNSFYQRRISLLPTSTLASLSSVHSTVQPAR